MRKAHVYSGFSASIFINLLLLLSFLVCYLQWGKDQSAFVFQMEYSLLSGENGFQNLIHPLIILPFIGQLLLLYAVFRKRTNKMVPLIAWALLSLLVVVILIAGVFASNLKIVASTIPFIIVSIWFFINRRKKKVKISNQLSDSEMHDQKHTDN